MNPSLQRNSNVSPGPSSAPPSAPAPEDGTYSVDLERLLVQRMVGGDESAFDEFADEYLPRLYRFAAARLRSRDPSGELARDIVQITACKVMQKIGSFRGDARLFTWLCTCCRNEILMYFRKAERQRLHLEWDDVDEGRLEVAPGEKSPLQNLSSKEQAKLVHQALDELPSRYAQALEWKYLECVSVQEIAERLALGVKAAESLLTRARLAFKTTFQTASEPSPGLPIVAGVKRTRS